MAHLEDLGILESRVGSVRNQHKISNEQIYGTESGSENLNAINLAGKDGVPDLLQYAFEIL